MAATAQPPKPLKLVADMIDSINAIKTLRCKVVALEKINNSYLSATSEIKIQTNPRKLYFINREKKLEILYVSGQFGDKAVVKPHVFPYFTLTLEPRGNIMRKNQHYTIMELGFEFIGKTFALALSKDKDNIAKNLSYVGKHERNGYKCHMLIYECKNFIYTEYTVQKHETLTSIALKLNVNDYLLRMKNNLFNDFGFLKEGTKLQVPVYYCKKAVLYIDEQSLLPVSITIYDETSVFESYDFTNIIVNKPIDQAEFTKEYKDYSF
jgi:hypothetical protein